MRVLVTGASGLLGRRIFEAFSKEHQVFGTYSNNKEKNLKKLDIRKKNQVKLVFDRYKPTLVIHTASITDVDFCETHQDSCYEVNVAGTEKLSLIWVKNACCLANLCSMKGLSQALCG